MRVTMYTEDYVPLTVIAAEDSQIEWLRRNPGDEVQFMESLPLYSAQSLARVPVANQYRGRIVVEGMEWADGVTRPILVVKGRSLGEALLSEHASPNAARDLFHSAVSQMRRDEPHPTYRRTLDRFRIYESPPTMYDATIVPGATMEIRRPAQYFSDETVGAPAGEGVVTGTPRR
jgi:hypothetical protein